MNNPGYKNINALLTLYEEEVLNFLQITIVSTIKFSDHALITRARKAYTDCYKSIINEKQQPAIDVAKREVLDFLT